MRQMAVFTTLHCYVTTVSVPKQMESKRFVFSIVYRVDAEETTRELADFGAPYKLFNTDGTSDEQTTSEFGGKLQRNQVSKIAKAI